MNNTDKSAYFPVSVLEQIVDIEYSLDNPINILLFWQNQPLEKGEKKITPEIFSVSANSAPIERVFLQAKFITRLHRNKTKNSLLNSKLLIYLNNKLLLNRLEYF